jgi:hypothetical protein
LCWCCWFLYGPSCDLPGGDTPSSTDSQTLYENGTHYWFEQSIKTIEETCTGVPGNTTLPLDQYETSGIGSQQIGFILTAIFFGLYHFGVMQNLVRKTKEREHVRGETLPLVSSIMRSLNNAAFRPLLGAWALDGLMLAALVTMFPFYIRYVIQPEGLEAQEKGMAMDSEVRHFGHISLAFFRLCAQNAVC